MSDETETEPKKTKFHTLAKEGLETTGPKEKDPRTGLETEDPKEPDPRGNEEE